jgi:hypothetical protein
MDIRWEGNVKDLVATVACSDARTRYIDGKTGAKISINISDVADPGFAGVFEPFYIESPDGENMYDAYNRKEASAILSNIRKGMKFPDMPDDSPKRKKEPKSKSKEKVSSRASVRGLRR